MDAGQRVRGLREPRGTIATSLAKQSGQGAPGRALSFQEILPEVLYAVVHSEKTCVWYWGKQTGLPSHLSPVPHTAPSEQWRWVGSSAPGQIQVWDGAEQWRDMSFISASGVEGMFAVKELVGAPGTVQVRDNEPQH